MDADHCASIYSGLMHALDAFQPATRAWFESSFPGPTPAQEQGWASVSAGHHTLIHAPTGSGKTLAAFLWTLDKTLHQPLPDRANRCRVLYVSPLKALAYDVDRNLRAPLAGIRHAAQRLGSEIELSEITVALRTGDTPQADRRRMQRHPPDILITTPESLYLMLTSQVRQILASVEYVIIDEVHAVAGTKRGAHLAVTLERLEAITVKPPQRIGLSATQRPLSTIGRFLAGGTIAGDGAWQARPIELVDVASDKRFEIDIVVPTEDMTAPVQPDSDSLEPPTRSIWPAVYPRLLELIQSHTSTILFANSRRLAERVSAELNRLAGTDLTRAHHGSVAREQRIEIEESLKRGTLACVVATSSLELGIDMGAVDLVIQVEAPSTVASGLQRVGRSGHQVGAASKATVFPKYRGDLLVATVVVDRMLQGAVEQTTILKNPLDVLAQQIVAMSAMDAWPVTEMYNTIRQSAPYAELALGPFEATLDMLAGRYPSDLFAELRPRIVWDRVENTITGRPGAQQLAVQNPGTIPDRGLFSVNLPDGAKVGELDEEMVYESRPGDVFVLGTTSWKISEITHDRVEVVPAPGAPGAKMPFWHGDAVGRPLETGRALGAFTRSMASLSPSERMATLTTTYHLDSFAAGNLSAYISEELEASGAVPSDTSLVAQRFRDEIGDWRLVLLSPLGAKVHAPWAMALTHRFRERFGHDVNAIWSNDGIAFRFADIDEPPTAADLLLEPEEVEQLLMNQLPDTALFAARFREAAARALLLPRRRPGKRTPLWQQRRRSADLLGVAKQFGTFPIILEVYREILQDDFDLPALVEVLGEIRSRKIRVIDVDLESPSPFATSLLFSFVAAFLYEADAPLAERRAAALTLDRDLLAELLGEGELRELLSEDALTSIELELQWLAEDRHAKSAESVVDMLRSLGPLSLAEVDARSDGDASAWTDDLLADRRIMQVTMVGEPRFAIVEDAARLRDALGIQPPQGIPFSLLEPVDDPLGDVVGRFARTHGPFTEADVGHALGLPVAVVTLTLERLAGLGRLVQGAFRPGGIEHEWVDTDVLRRLKRRSLAELRREIEPVSKTNLANFLIGWHGIGGTRRGTAALSDVISQLQGAAIPASVIERDVLPVRMEYDPSLLDQLMASGEVVWAGRGSLGPKNGRIALYFRDTYPLLRIEAEHRPTSETHERIRSHLRKRGASFFSTIYQAAGGGDPAAVLDSLWDLVWAGEVTNDTMAPLRAILAGSARRKVSRRPLPSTFPPASAGRWYLTEDLVSAEPSATERLTAWADLALDRHGVVTRLGIAEEGIPGAFSAIYPVLTRMEETGRIRRGYFVEGLGGAQFAVPGAVDRVRSDMGNDVVLMSTSDPAFAYGGAIPWPESSSRVARTAGSYVVLAGGQPILFLEQSGKKIITFTDDENLLKIASPALAEAGRRRKKLAIETVDSAPIGKSALGIAMAGSGFVAGPRGLVFRG